MLKIIHQETVEVALESVNKLFPFKKEEIAYLELVQLLKSQNKIVPHIFRKKKLNYCLRCKKSSNNH